MNEFNRQHEPQPVPYAITRFLYHCRTAEEEEEDGVEGPRITVARWNDKTAVWVDTGIPFVYTDSQEVFTVPTGDGENVIGTAIYFPDGGHWEPLARCG